MIGVTGASGKLGQAILERLSRLDRGERRVVACSRNPSATQNGLADELRAADFSRYETLEPAFHGLETLLVVSVEAPDEVRVELHRNAVKAARAAGVRRIVYTSFLDVDPASPSFVAKVHRETEADIRASGLSWVMLRDGPYLDNSARRIAAAANRESVFRWSSASAALPFISRDDLAEAAAVAALSDLKNAALRLTGPELLSFDDLCRLVSDRVGRTISFQSISDEDFGADLKAHGLADDLIRRRVAYAQAMRLGFLSALTDDFRSLTGRNPENAATALQAINLNEPIH